ncbi:MAG: helix-turn-helix domain-containing protein [Bacteroidia bacterium]
MSIFLNQSDIENLITSQAEESTYLEFKAAAALSKTDKTKTEITKDVSAFANADGGVLIYGIAEKEHKAATIDFIDGNTFTKEWLQQIIDQIQRKIPGLEIIPVRFNNEIQNTIYIVSIPRSNEGAHQASDRRFYKRRNFRNDMMEEYEIRESYNRTQKTELEILDPLISGNGHSDIGAWMNDYTINLQFFVSNTGKVIENIYKLEVRLPSQLLIGQFQPEFGNCFDRHEGNHRIYLFPQKSELYPEEKNSVSQAYFKLNAHGFSLFATTPMILKLYYSSGTKEREIYLLPYLKHIRTNGMEHTLTEKCFQNQGCQ